MECPNLILLNVEHVTLGPEWNWRNVSSPFMRLFFITGGHGGRLLIGRESVDLHPGCVYLIPPGTEHSYECDGCFSQYYLHIYEKPGRDPSLFERYDFRIENKVDADEFSTICGNLCEHYPEFRLSDYNPSVYDNRSVFYNYVERYEALDAAARFYLNGVLLVVFSRVMANATPKKWINDKRMVNVLNYVNVNLHRDIAVGDMARVACMAPTYFSRCFRNTFGMTPLRYVLMKKVEMSRQLLLTENQSVKEIAYSVGFNDCSYFIRVFKRITGLTPQKYRISGA